ncbi:hypothetical protein [Virgibacillus salexigens]|uniref:hypothetical protein n=1 Tax=Virgibacillus TaxID=84406 RepID=UPI000571F62F|nr:MULTISPECIES: hypothetical protein [Virgibacillus]MYL42503.1 hypothetical protein [Virgibacillus massiliensis]
MGRGNAIFDDVFYYSSGDKKLISPAKVTKEIEDKRQLFYCSGKKCNAKLSHNIGKGKNPKSYFF